MDLHDRKHGRGASRRVDEVVLEDGFFVQGKAKHSDVSSHPSRPCILTSHHTRLAFAVSGRLSSGYPPVRLRQGLTGGSGTVRDVGILSPLKTGVYIFFSL